MPFYDKQIHGKIRKIIDTQLNDNVKARMLTCGLENQLMRSAGPPVQSQLEIYRMLKEEAGLGMSD